MKQISQSQIQDFQFCHRKYYLAHVRRLAWPAPITPSFRKMEENMRQGKAFHLFVHRYLQNILPENGQPVDPAIQKWVDNFKAHHPLPAKAQIFTEKEVTTVLGDTIWIGDFDVLAVQPDRIQIFDWKTSEKPGDPLRLKNSPQTRLYLFLLLKNLNRFTRSRLNAENLEMIYWYPNAPLASVRIAYSNEKAQQDESYLQRISAQLSSDQAEDYLETDDRQKCSYCRYQKFCYPETVFDLEDAADPDIDWELPETMLETEDFYAD